MIKHIIFDFGGVLMDLDYRLTMRALRDILGVDFKDDKFINWFLELFKLFEKDGVSSADFIKALQAKSSKSVSDDMIIEAWNAMIIGLRRERFEMLKELKSSYGVYLLSNSNHIHYDKMIHMTTGMFGPIDFHKEFFHQAYYSQLLKMRKPDKEIFDFICAENNLNKKETLFIDDLQPNIDGAINAGLAAIRHDPQTEITKQLEGYIMTANKGL